MKDYIINFQESKYQYNFVLYQLGYEKCKKDHSFGPVARDFYVLHFVVEGEGELIVENKRFMLKKGDCFLVPTNKISKYSSKSDNPYEYYWVGFNGTAADQVLEHLGFLKNDVYVNSFEKQAEAVEILKSLLEDETALKNDFRTLGAFYQMLGLLVKDDGLFQKADSETSLMRQLIHYVDTNYMNDITIEDMAKYVNIHRSNVFRLFKKNYGVSPKEYIVNCRMEKALFFLKNSDLSVKAIAYAVGYNNPSYFCKMFKKKYKKTTGQARALA